MLQPDLRGDDGRTPQQGEAERRHAVEHGAAAAGRRRRTQTATLIAPSTDSPWPPTKPAAGPIRNTPAPPNPDPTSGVSGQRGSVRGAHGGRRIIKKKH